MRSKDKRQVGRFVVSIALCASAFVQGALAQTTRSVADGYEDNIKSAQTIAALGPDLFGEQVNLKDGATSFTAVDVSVKTNSGLPVSIGRSLGINARDIDQYANPAADGELFGNWKLDVPYMHGVFDQATGWVSSMPNPQQRCSVSSQYTMAVPDRPSMFKNGINTFTAAQYSTGAQVNIPGSGEENLLYLPSDRTRPADGRTYYATTRSNWRVSCLTSLLNGSGEGFQVVLPNGMRYTFNWLSSRLVSQLEDTVCNVYYGCPSGVGMIRREYFLHATRIEDRFGNWVAYSYNASSPRQLDSITSSDGAAISLTYAGGKITSITSHGRTWQYQYADASRTILSAVVRPDGSRWSFQYNNIQPAAASETKSIWHDCEPVHTNQSVPPTVGQSVAITHPSGATGTFRFRKINHGTANTPGGCYDPDPDKFNDQQLTDIVAAYRIASLYEKTVTGAGLQAATWSYRYAPNWSWSPTGYSQPNCSQYDCTSRTTTDVTGPDGVLTRYVFGNDYWVNAGQLLETHVISGGITRKSTYQSYLLSAAGQPFPDSVGIDPNLRNNPLTSQKQRPSQSSVVHQQGATFNRFVDTYDAWAQPTTVRAWSTGTASGITRSEGTTYAHNLAHWVIGQPATVTINGMLATQNGYDALARLEWANAFGKRQQTLTYNVDGTLATVKDGNNNLTTLSLWHRGVPRRIDYADGTYVSASVNDNGWVTSVVDENGYSTGYGYDDMGRLASIVHPAGDSTAWNNVTMVFKQINVADRGLPAGHWRLDRTEGSRRTHTYYDGMWRPVMVLDYDITDGNIQSQVIKRYDASGRLAFQSYPTRHVFDLNNSALTGTWTDYDALDRPWRTRQDWEGSGQLTTTTEYLAGFQTRVTNPRNYQTTTGYYAYDMPGYDSVAWSIRDAGNGNDQTIQIQRDVFGKPTQLRQSGYTGGVLSDVSRHYVYNPAQELCKTIEPETGATAMAYDGAGNLQWSAAGLALPSTTSCDTDLAYGSSRTVNRSYNTRNRLTSLQFPDGIGNQAWTYTPDGLPETITAYNAANNGAPIVTSYHYNKRRLLDGQGETLTQTAWYAWGIGYGYDGNANLAAHAYPAGGLTINYAPNALGQATRAMDGTGKHYASAATYHPNGALAQFTYGNGLVHTMSQNARQLPLQVRSGTVTGYEYWYDANGNPTHLHDLVQGGNYSRLNQYDGLDRLAASGSASYGGDAWHRFTYDALDNLTSWTLGGVKDYAHYVYDASNRLTRINNTTGIKVVGLTYDVQGNLSQKDGQSYTFDYGNRLRGVPSKETYRYDALGRRVQSTAASGATTTVWQYSQAGQLMYSSDWQGANYQNHKTREHIYLAGSLIATIDHTWPTNAVLAVKYQHTDALGSPVAVTNEAGQVIERTQWEPYGAAIGKPSYNGVGYTGHVMDGATGLTYMQQRYYDQTIGRFLSVDPVTAHAKPGQNFNRYWYGNNNPYKLTDPDGRLAADSGFGRTPSRCGVSCDDERADRIKRPHGRTPESFSSAGTSTPSTPAQRIDSASGEAQKAYVLRVGKIIRSLADKEKKEVCGTICNVSEAGWTTKLFVSLSHVTCEYRAECSDGKYIHAHGPLFFRVNKYDAAYLEQQNIYRSIGSRMSGQDRNSFSPTDYLAGPGYLAGDRGVIEQNGRGTQTPLGDYDE